MAARPVVLVVDDHAPTRRLAMLALRELPQSRGFRLEEAPTPEAALERIERAFRQREPLFVVCDDEMPRMGGLEVLGRVARRSTAAFRFVLMLFEPRPEVERAAFERGADDVFLRSFDLRRWEERLSGRIDRWLVAARTPVAVGAAR